MRQFFSTPVASWMEDGLKSSWESEEMRGRVLVPQAHPVAEDLEALGVVEVAEAGQQRERRRVERLVELARRRHRGRREGEPSVARPAPAAGAAASRKRAGARGDVAGATAAPHGSSGGDGAGRALVARRGGGRRGVGWESDNILVLIKKN